MATYVNDLRLTELATGEGSGTWGTTTNTSLELIGEALGYATQQAFGSDADATTTVADGASDPARAMYYKITSAASLTATRTLTIAPNTISRVMFIENATSGSQSIAISQGSGASVTILTGKTAVVYLDGAGATAAVVDAMAGVDPGVTDTLTEVLVAGNTSGGTNIELSTTDKVQFRDAAIYLNSSVDGQLDIVADTEIQIAATTVDLNGNLDVSGTALVTGVLTTTAATVFNGGFASNADSTLGTDKKVQFRDSAIYINSSVDGQLDLVADTEIQIAATTIDVNGTLAFDSLKGTGATTVTNILDEDNMASDSATAIATQQSIKAYVDSQVGSFDTLAEVLAQGNTTGGTDLAVSTGDDITFADNSKAIFGAGSDLQIYSDGTTGQVTGNVNVTGTVTADGLVVDGNTQFNSASAAASGTRSIQFYRDSAERGAVRFDYSASAMELQADGSFFVSTGGEGTSLLIDGSTRDINFYDTAGTTAKMVWDASAESLGIGTASPANKLDVYSGSFNSAVAHFTGASAGRGLLLSTFARGSNDDSIDYDVPFAGGAQTWSIAGAEKLRLDQSGNLLVGKTASNSTVAGAQLNSNGLIIGTTSETNPLLLNRLSTAGDIITMQKDGTTVGSIGYNSGNGFYMHTPFGNDSGLVFGSERIVPCTSTGAFDDAVVDLGYESGRFKDLYLSGGVYLGGTGAANLLEDYEEGTWDITVTDGTNNATLNASYNTGVYTKIGRLVTLTGRFIMSSKGSLSGAIYIGGIPFNGIGGNSYNSGGFIAGKADGLNLTAGTSVGGEISSNSNVISLTVWDIADGSAYMDATNLDATADMSFAITYMTGA
jgi:hypothetical protein